MTVPRYYCYRTGHAVAWNARELERGRCGECGAPTSDHRQVPAGTCGNFAPCLADPDHGHMCVLPEGHAGECSAGSHERGDAEVPT